MKYLTWMALLLFSGPSSLVWAGQSSFFDSTTGKIVMATASKDGTVFLRVLDPGTGAIASGYQATCGTASGNPVQAGSGATELSLAYDSAHASAYVFYADATGTRMVKCAVGAGAPPPTPPTNGACGSSNGGTFTSAPATNLCNAGTPTSVTGSGPWTWSCAGLNGGSTAACSADKTTTPPTNGACGLSNGQTFTSAPTANLCSAGTPTSVTGSGPWYWTCPGTNGGTPASCSANIQTSGLSDLIVSSMLAVTSVDNNSPFAISMTVRNQGTGSAGPFAVTVYVGKSYLPGGTVLLTWNVGGLAAGQSISQTFVNNIVNNLATHGNYYFVIKADSGDIITETDETNNVKYRYFTVAR